MCVIEDTIKTGTGKNNNRIREDAINTDKDKNGQWNEVVKLIVPGEFVKTLCDMLTRLKPSEVCTFVEKKAKLAK